MSTGRTAAQIDAPLTDYASGVAQDKRDPMAEWIAPQCPVAATIGHYKELNEKNAFQYIDTLRAIGGDPIMIQFEATDPTFNCKPHALGIPIDDSERDAAGEFDPALEESRVDSLITVGVVSNAVDTLAVVKANVTAETGMGDWLNADTNPVDEIDSCIEDIAVKCGMVPNAMALDIGSWRVIKNHPKVKANMPGGATTPVTIEAFAGMLLNPNIEIKLGALAYDTAKMGKTASKKFVMANEVLIFIRQNNPSTFDPSALKTFVGRRGGLYAVYSYRKEPFVDVKVISWSSDVKLTSSIGIKRITIQR